jgi:nucleoside 2-deoxyribosyltransferase
MSKILQREYTESEWKALQGEQTILSFISSYLKRWWRKEVKVEDTLVYIASPYSHPDPKVKEQRYEQACKAAAWYMDLGFQVFCPIAHSHPIETIGMGSIRNEAFWLHQDFAILRHCDRLVVLTIDGWRESQGVAREIEFACVNKIPVDYDFGGW